MKAERAEALVAHLAREPLAPCYLVAGQEELLVLEAADAVRQAARRQGFDERRVLEAGESGFDWAALAMAGQQGSLFGGGRTLIDLRLPSGKAGREGSEALAAWAQAPTPDSVLLVTCLAWSREHERAAWVGALATAGWQLVLWPLRRHELPAWIAERARRLGLALAADAIDLLALRTEGNLLACAQELDKLVLAGETGPLGADRLAALLAEQSRLDVFALTDAVLAGEPGRALRILRALRAEGEAPAALVPWLGSQIEVLARAAEASAGGQPEAAALRAEKVWQSRIDLYARALRRIGQAGLVRALSGFAEAERQAKGQGPGLPWLTLERLIVRLAVGGRRVRA
ncbi:MAG: DNA polymerase III subunit delta [Xanthomonadales bacterium]|nr:DNA polymerase III subunit delta [Xanthomonadales bacterium]